MEGSGSNVRLQYLSAFGNHRFNAPLSEHEAHHGDLSQLPTGTPGRVAYRYRNGRHQRRGSTRNHASTVGQVLYVIYTIQVPLAD